MTNHKNSINLIAQNPQSTIVAKYTPSERKSESYQTEEELEKEFIKQLVSQGYEYLEIKTNDDLVKNLRKQIEKLNNYKFTDNEWENFFKWEIANPNKGIEEKTETIQEDHIKILKCDDWTEKNIYLLDKKNIHNNYLQVINQYTTEWGKRPNRYDVTILVNGLPLVHIELKRRWVALKEAFNQIDRYQRESFWADSGLFEYVQIFVISNWTYTKYYSNTTRFSHVQEQKKSNRWKKTKNSFEFTSWWTDFENKKITDLVDFTKTFFSKHTLLNILIKYCVFTVDRNPLVMRPYQIAATERIINKIEISHNYKKYWTKESGWYIWHTTWSWKTLTSFKTAQLATKLDYIDKVLFIVDRKDLDHQTMREYDKFEKGAADSNTSTKVLQRQLEDPNKKIIITTIQKLDRFIKKNKDHSIFDGEIVLIFDECHRSQFGNMHRAITKAFKKYYIFWFTWTPIFAVNSSSWAYPDLKTTEQAFWERLHTYTIVDAIADGNVLPFKVDYVSTIKEAENIEDKKIKNIDKERALSDHRRISKIVKYILEHFDQKTKRNEYYKLKDKRLRGFNSIFAVASIDMLKLYYNEFKRQLKDLPTDKQLKIATIFSYSANEEEPDGTIDENPEDTNKLDQSSRDFLEDAIKDYNKMFWTSYDTSSEKFQNYYKDVSERVKNKEIDILIVVNMFLTGFDAPTLNTLWVDKNLRLHWLIQAFSRTNRILNSIKTFWNIVCFRNLEKATNEAIALFGDKNAKSIVLLKTFKEYYYGYKNNEGKEVKGYKQLVDELLEKFPIWNDIISEEKKKEFIKLYGTILKVHNTLTSFDEFAWKEILTERDFQDYHSIYIDLYDEFRKTDKAEKEVINDDLVFEIELIKQVEINIDYILRLIQKYHANHMKNKEVLIETVNRAIRSSMELRNKKDLIEEFIHSLDASSSVYDDWHKFVQKKKKEELDKIINEESLNKEETYKFIEDAFSKWYVQETGTSIAKILPPISRFSKDRLRTKKRESVLQKLINFFERFFGISDKKI